MSDLSAAAAGTATSNVASVKTDPQQTNLFVRMFSSPSKCRRILKDRLEKGKD